MRWYADPDTSMAMTEKIAADTRAWRAGADRILGFWDEELIADRESSITTTEMLAEFNRWLSSNGHNSWPKETFGPRFIQHSETARHGVEWARPNQVKNLSTRNAFTVPKRPAVYQGVRFQTAFDKDKDPKWTDRTD